MDLYEKADTVTIELELPGVNKDDIEVYVMRDLVTIEGVKLDNAGPTPSSGPLSFLRLERKQGRFFREIELPVPCNTRAGKARFERGLLVLEFEKVKDRRGQRCRIEIK
jgi:HSP20 family protein